MATSTPLFHLRYPQPPDPADVPTDMQNLATDVEATIGVLGYATRASNLTGFTGTTFAAGSDVFSSPISFTADGSSWYRVAFGAAYWTSSVAATLTAAVSLDGTQAAQLMGVTIPNGGNWAVAAGFAPIQPAAGAHTLNVRVWVGGGSGTVGSPMLVVVDRLRLGR